MDGRIARIGEGCARDFAAIGLLDDAVGDAGTGAGIVAAGIGARVDQQRAAIGEAGLRRSTSTNLLNNAVTDSGQCGSRDARAGRRIGLDGEIPVIRKIDGRSATGDGRLDHAGGNTGLG